MSELELQERPGLFTRLKGFFSREEEYDDEAEPESAATTHPRLHQAHRYTIVIRRQVLNFQDAVAAADGIKRGEQQILNLSMCDPSTRERIKDFMCGVNYAEEGTWEELGENVFLVAPSFALVETAPSTPRMQAAKN